MLKSCTPGVQHACCQLYWMKERENKHIWLIWAGSDQSRFNKTEDVHLTFFLFSTLKCILQFHSKSWMLKASHKVQLGEALEWETDSLNTEQLEADSWAGRAVTMGKHMVWVRLQQFCTSTYTFISGKPAQKRRSKEQLCDCLFWKTVRKAVRWHLSQDTGAS